MLTVSGSMGGGGGLYREVNPPTFKEKYRGSRLAKVILIRIFTAPIAAPDLKFTQLGLLMDVKRFHKAPIRTIEYHPSGRGISVLHFKFVVWFDWCFS